MREPPRVPLEASQLELDTPIEESIRLPGHPAFEELLDRLEDALRGLGIDVERRREGMEVVIEYRCSIGEALRLGFDRTRPGELQAAVERAYPWLDADRRAIRVRLARLARGAGEGARVRPKQRPSTRRPSGVRRKARG